MKAAKQLPVYLFSRIFPAAIGFFGISLYTHLLDPSSFGAYAILLSISLLVGLTGYSWLRVATLRMLASITAEDEPNFVATIALSFLGTTALVAVAVLLILHFYNDNLSLSLVSLTALSAIASNWFELNVTVAQARSNLITVAALQITRSTVALVSTVLLIRVGLKVEALLGGFVLGNLASAGSIFLWKASICGKFKRVILLRLLNFGWPGSVAGMVQLSATYLRYTLEIVATTASVGVYAAAVDFTNQTISLLMGTSSLAGQTLAFRARDRGTHEELLAQLCTNAKILLIIGVGATAGIIALAEPLSRLYIGSKFHAAVGSHVDQVIILSAFGVCLGGLRGNYFEQAFEIVFKTWPLMVLMLIRTTITIVVGYFFVRMYGILGAAATTVVSDIVSTSVGMVWGRKFIVMPLPIVSLAKTIIAATFMALAISLVPQRDTLAGLTVAIGGGFVVYGLILCLLFREEVMGVLAPYSPRRKVIVEQ